MPDQFRMPGDIELSDVIIVGGSGEALDVTDMVFDISIFEAIGQIALYGRVQLVDAENVLGRFNLTGQELFSFTVKYGLDITKTFQFFITKLDSLDYEPPGLVATYTFTIVSRTAFINAGMLVSQAFEGTIDKIIEKIYEDYLGVELRYKDECSGNYRCIVPNMNPMDAISWLEKRAIDANGVPIRVVNTLNNGTSLESFDTMFQRNSMEEFFINMNPTEKGSEQGAAYEIRNIFQKPQTFHMKQHSNAYNQMTYGTHGATFMNIDSVNKTSSILEFDGEEEFNKKPRLSKNLAINTNFKYGENETPMTKTFKTRNIMSYHTGPSFGNEFLNYNSDFNSTVSARRNYRGILSTYMYEMSVAGRWDIECGSVIWLNFPTHKLQDKSSPESLIDNKKSGRYLVTACNHNFKSDKYTLTLEICTDGIGEEYGVE